MNYGDMRKVYKRPTFLKKVNQIENPKKTVYRAPQGDLSSSNRQKLDLNSPDDINDEIDISNNPKIPYITNFNKTYNIYNINNLEIVNNSRNKNQKIFKNKKEEKKEENKEENKEEELPIKKQNFKWFKYIWYLICCRSNDKMITYYESIRSSLISEENIIQNYLDIYKLLKINGIPKKTSLII